LLTNKDEICKQIKSGKFKRSLVDSPNDLFVSVQRTSSYIVLKDNALIVALRDRVAKNFGCDSKQFELLQVVKYKKGPLYTAPQGIHCQSEE
jgi:hypothetical protein